MNRYTSCNEAFIGKMVFEDEHVSRRVLLGALSVNALSFFIMRIIFATVQSSAAKNANVAFATVVSVCNLMIVFGLANAWWLSIFKDQNNRLSSPIEVPYGGFFRKTTHLISLNTSDGVNKACRWVILFLELGFVGCGMLGYIIVGFILADSQNERARENDSPDLKTYYAFAILFNAGSIAFLIDLVLAVLFYRYFGLKRVLLSNKIDTTNYSIGIESTTWQRWDSKLIASLSLLLIINSSLLIRLLNGWCPYIDYTEDFYHGGDPAEYTTQDLMNFLIYFVFTGYFTRIAFLDAYMYWKPANYGKSDTISFSDTDSVQMAKRVNIVEVVLNTLIFVISLCLILVDNQYKYDAGMVGRMLYFFGYLLTVGSWSSREFLFALADVPKNSIFLGMQIFIGCYILYVVTVFIVGAVKWTSDSYKSTNMVDKFDNFLLFNGIIMWFLHALFLLAFEKIQIVKPKESDDGIEMETQKTMEESEMQINIQANDISAHLSEIALQDTSTVEESHAETSPAVETSEDHEIATLLKVGFAFRGLSDFSKVLSVFFYLWCLLAICWNALSILFVMYSISKLFGLYMEDSWMKSHISSGGKPHTSIPFTKKLLKHSIQLVIAVAFFFFYNAWYFLGTPLPYYEPQILIAGHRGVWTEGYAENSKEAFVFAKSEEYAGVEFDMRMTRDQKLVVMHDTTLERTTNGTGNVYDYDLVDVEKLSLKRDGTDVYVPWSEEMHPYSMDQVLKITKPMNLINNIEVKQDVNLSAIPLALQAMCDNNVTNTSFISTGDMRFQHLLYYLEPNVTLEKDFLLHTAANSLNVPLNVNVYAISAELLLFNTWVIPNAHQAGMMVLVYFLAIETPGMINYFKYMGVDGFMLNNPVHCANSGNCKPPKKFVLPRVIYIPP